MKTTVMALPYRIARSKPRKFSPGLPFESLDAFRAAMDAHEWVFINNAKRPTHFAFARNQQFWRLAALVSERRIHRAVRNPDFPYVFTARRIGGNWEKANHWVLSCDELPDFIGKTALTMPVAISFCQNVAPPDHEVQVNFINHPIAPRYPCPF